MSTETTGGFTGSPLEALDAPSAAGGCCGSAPTTEAAQPGGCCGTAPAQAEPAAEE